MYKVWQHRLDGRTVPAIKAKGNDLGIRIWSLREPTFPKVSAQPAMLSSSRSFDAERKAAFSFTFSLLYSASRPPSPAPHFFYLLYLFYYFCKQFIFLHILLFPIYTYSVTSRIHIPAGGVLSIQGPRKVNLEARYRS